MSAVQCLHQRAIRIVSLCALTILMLTWLAPDASRAAEKIDLSELSGPLADNGLPENWKFLKFPSIANQTNYDVVSDEMYGPVFRARSTSAAGGIARSVSADLKTTPILNWIWKIDATIPDSSLTSASGDDFPVRVMVSFAPYGSNPQQGENKILCYVWAANEPLDSFHVNPIHDHILTVVASSGNRQRGSWVRISRNLIEDYRRIFSEEPGKVAGLVLMTDSDNTKSSTQAWYGPIWLSSDGYSSRTLAR